MGEHGGNPGLVSFLSVLHSVSSCSNSISAACSPSGFMLLRYETGHSSVLAGFTSEGLCIISCADFECELAIIDVESAEVLATETFDGLQEGRNKAGYVIGPGGRQV